MTQAATPTAALFTPMGATNTETPPSLPSTAPQPATAVTPAAQPASKPPTQKHNPLHGITLEAMVTALSEHYGWPGLAERIPVRCFALNPSVKSSLAFLRKTPWAREKVEGLYLFMLREIRRQGGR